MTVLHEARSIKTVDNHRIGATSVATAGDRSCRTPATWCMRRGSRALPPEYDLRPSMPPVYDQGQLGSCTGNAIAGAMEYERDRQGLSDFVPSRLFVYYNERALEGTVSSDAGAPNPGRHQGRQHRRRLPGDAVALRHRDVRGEAAEALLCRRDEGQGGSVRGDPTLGDLKDAIASNLSVVFGFTVYQSFESQAVAQTGVMPLPKPR